MCSFAPSLAPCSPHLSCPASSMCPSSVSACSAFVFFLCGSVLALLAAPAPPACALCPSWCYPDPAALRPLSRLSPLPFSFSLSTLPARLPSLSVQRCHSCVPLACSTPAPRPYPFPWVLPRSPPLTPSWLPGALCGGGGGACICGLDCGPVSPLRRRRLPNSRRCICIVEPGHQGLALSIPLSMAHVSSMFSMQHLPATQRALLPCTKSADSPHTPAASPLGRHRDVAPLHRIRVHLHCHLRIPAIPPITPLAKTLTHWMRLPVRLSCKSEPWRRAAPEGHSAAPRLRRPFLPVTTSRSAPSP